MSVCAAISPSERIVAERGVGAGVGVGEGDGEGVGVGAGVGEGVGEGVGNSVYFTSPGLTANTTTAATAISRSTISTVSPNGWIR